MRIIGTIEARMGSTRLPGKTMAEVHNGKTLLECVVRRFQACPVLDDVVVATTTSPKDDAIAAWCRAANVPVFRGSEENVLERVLGAAQHHRADAIVQMGADSAYLDYQLVEQLVGHFRAGKSDYVCNDLPLTYPLGIYGHVVRVSALADVARQADLSDKDRSDVVRYIWEHPGRYSISNVTAPPDMAVPSLRLTIDYPEDLQQAREVYSLLGGGLFTTAQVLELAQRQPGIFEKTRRLVQQSAPHLPGRA